MRASPLLLALLLPVAALAAPSTPAPVALERTVSGRIVIAPDGHVQDLALDPSGAQEIDAAVDRAIRAWLFKPVVVDGRAVSAETRMQVDLVLEPVEADYQLRVKQARFGVAERKPTLQVPRYPEAAARAGLGAKVVLALKLEADGRVAQVHVEQASLDKRAPSENVAVRWRRVFEQAAVTAASRWRFETLERVDGRAADGTVRIPVVFMMGDDRNLAWHAYVPGPYHPVPWVRSQAVAQEQLDALRDGQAQALAPRVQLAGEVAGVVL